MEGEQTPCVYTLKEEARTKIAIRNGHMIFWWLKLGGKWSTAACA